jgi:hypothetical protein
MIKFIDSLLVETFSYKDHVLDGKSLLIKIFQSRALEISKICYTLFADVISLCETSSANRFLILIRAQKNLKSLN